MPSFRIRSLISVCTAVLTFLVVLQPTGKHERDSFSGQIREEEGNALDALRWYNNQRAYPTGSIPADWRERASAQIARMKGSRIAASVASAGSLSWIPVGPSNIAGRVRSIAIDPTNLSVLYCGSVSGGIWKSTSGGLSWSPLTDIAPNLVIGCIAIHPSNPAIIYAGTGEGYFNVDALRGIGILKSTDSGTTWSVIGRSSFTGADTNSQIYYINKIVIRPDRPDTLFAAVSATGTGIWKSYNAGLTWSKVAATTLTPKICTDLVIDPTNPDIMYASFGLFSYTDGIYKSTNGGTTWRKLNSSFPAPSTGYRRISLAISPSTPSILYACLEDSNHYTHSIQKSTNGGSSWITLAAPYDNTGMVQGTHLGGQGWYNNVIAVDPTNPDIVFTGGINLFKSTNGGTSWNRISDGYGTPYVHVDQHAILFDPADHLTMYFGNDGGVFRSTDGGVSFRDLNAGLITTQFYSGAVHPSADVWYGGTQDNGTLKSGGTSTWSQILGGDGGCTLVDFNTPSVVYTEYPYLSFLKSINGGGSWSTAMGSGANTIPYNAAYPNEGTTDRCSFITPVVMDPNSPQVLYAGTYRLYRSSNSGQEWIAISGDLTGDGTGANQPRGISDKAVISAIGLSRSSPQTIYTGSSGSATVTPKIFVTTDLGSHWTEITKANVPRRYISAIAVDPGNRDRVVVGFSGYGGGHVFMTTDRGTTWSDISSDLPDIPVNSIIIDPTDVNHLVIGTDVGVFATNAAGNSWISQDAGLANVSVNQLILRPDGILFAATHGRGMFRTVFPISTMSPLELILHQNSALPRYMDLYVTSSESLSALPSMLITAGMDVRPVTLVQQSPRIYRGSYEFSQDGIHSIQVSAVDSVGQTVSVTRNFSAVLAKSGIAVTAYTPDSSAQITISPGAVADETYFTLVPERAAGIPGSADGTACTFGPAGDLRSPVEIAFRYGKDATIDGNVPAIYRNTGNGWEIVDGSMDESNRLISARVTKLGRYAPGSANGTADHQAAPQRFRLDQNYPNPFNPVTTIRFELTDRANVTLAVYDISGRMIRLLADGSYAAGIHQAVWDGTVSGGEHVASGVYFYRLTVTPEGKGASTLTRKMVLIR